MDRSRLRLGPFRFLPSVDVSDAGYNSNVFGATANPQASWTATLVAGTKLIVPLGSKVYFLGDAFPRYSWYASFPDLNRFGGNATAGLAAFFNRLSLQAALTGAEQFVTSNAELQAPTFRTTYGGFGKLDVDLTSNVAFFAAGRNQKVRQTQNGVPPPDRSNVAINDRTDDEVDGGFRYKLGKAWSFAPELQYTRSVFVETPELRNNTSVGYLLGIGYDEPRWYLNLVAGYREGKSFEGSAFPTYATPVGSFFLSFFVRPWLEIRGYGHRHVYYSVDVVNPYFFGNLVGGGLNIQVLRDVLLRGYAETGRNDYPVAQPVAGGGTVKRQDDVLYYGGGVSVILFNRVTLTGLVTQRNDDSNIPSNSYSILQFSTFLSFSAEFMR